MADGDNKTRALVSYLTLRRVVGVLGVALPVVLALWGFALFQGIEIRASISDYYNDRTRDAFVGILFVVAWFLYAYRGYELKDDVAGNLAFIFALGVALFPNSGTKWQQIVHFASAAALFLVLSYFSLFLFTKSSGHMTRQKRMRNVVYRTCGVVILACIAMIGLYSWQFDGTTAANLKPVFWLESLALWAFGLSWLIKGETLLRDSVI